MKMPGATGDVTGEPLSSRLNSPAAKKCVLLDNDVENGPPRETADWPSESLVDRKSTRLNSSHLGISYAVFCLKKKKKNNTLRTKLNKGRIIATRAIGAG